MKMARFFPISYKMPLLPSILIYLCISIFLGVPIGMLSFFLQMNTIFSLVLRFLLLLIAGFAEVYSVFGIVLSVIRKVKKL